MYVRRPLYAPNMLERTIGTGNALLVYQQGQDVWFWLGEENSGRHSFINLGAWHCRLRSKQLLFRVKKMVVIHPERHP